MFGVLTMGVRNAMDLIRCSRTIQLLVYRFANMNARA